MGLASRLGNRFKAEFASRILTVVSGATLTVALARLLEPDGYGLLFLALSIIGLSKTLSILGIPKSGARYLSEYKEKDPEQITYIIEYTSMLTIALMMIVSLAFLIGHEYLAELVGEPKLTNLLLVGVLFIIFGTLTSLIEGILLGFEAIESKAVLHAINHVARLPFALALVILGYGAVGALTGYILASVLAVLIGVPYLYISYYQGLNQGDVEPMLFRRIAKYAVPLTATQAAKILDKRVDIILVGFFINPTAVGFYSVSRQVVSFIQSPIGALGTTLGPTFQTQKARGNPDVAARMYEEALSHGLLLYISAAAGLILVAGPTIELVFGSQYIGAVPVLQVLALWAVLRPIMAITTDALDFLGRARERAIVFTVSAVLNVILNVIFIPVFGVVGAAIATVVTYALYTFASAYYVTVELDLRITWLLRQIIGAIIIASIMAFCIQFLIEYITGIYSLVGVVGVGVGIWLILSISFGYLDLRRIISILS